MQYLTTMKPILQGTIAAAITVAVGLLLVLVYCAVNPTFGDEREFSKKLGRNVEWRTWSSTVEILTGGVVDQDAVMLVFNLIPEQLGGPYHDLRLEWVVSDEGRRPPRRRFSRGLPRREFFRARDMERLSGRRRMPGTRSLAPSGEPRA